MTDELPDRTAADHHSEMIMEPARAEPEKAIRGMVLEQQVRLVLSMPWKDRQDVIMAANNAHEIIQSLPAEEIYWMIKERGITDSLPVLSRTTNDQLQYVLDIDCWHSDRLDFKTTLGWYGMIMRCNEQKVLEWIRSVDDDLIVATMKRFVRIMKIEHETDMSEEYESMPLYTLDGQNYLSFSSDDARTVFLPLLNLLYQYDVQKCHSIIEGIIFDYAHECEDEAYRWRCGRVADRGFPDPSEAYGVYAPLSGSEKRHVEACASAPVSSANVYHKKTYLMRYGIQSADMPGFLYDALLGIDDDDRLSEVQQHIVNLANKIITADGLRVREIDDLHTALEKALGCLSIGAEAVSGGGREKASRLLASAHPELIFRAGNGCIADVQARAKSHAWHLAPEDEYFRTFHAVPLADAVTGLLRPRPVFYRGIDSQETGYRNFRSMADIASVRQCLETAVAADSVVFEVLGCGVDSLLAPMNENTDREEPGSVTSHALFLTLTAQHVISGTAAFDALTAGDLQRFCDRVFTEQHDAGRRIGPDVVSSCISWLRSRNPQAIEERFEGIERFVAGCFRELENELADMKEVNDTDTRYITCLIMKQ